MNPRFTADTRNRWTLPLALFLATLATALGAYHGRAADSEKVPYPLGYRSWTHVRTVLVGPQSPFFESGGGMHHIYANAKAIEGYNTGHFPDGSILVFDLLETREKDGTISEGPRKRIDVMLKDSDHFSSTGGWDFERFLGDTKTPALTEEHRKACFQCHEQAKTHEFVFSVYQK